MEADPKDLQFNWVMNTSSNSIAIYSFTVNNSKSVTSHVIENRFSYGFMFCNAENNIGKSKKPCIFHLKPPGILVLNLILNFSFDFLIFKF